MNDILELKGEFQHRSNVNASFGPINLLKDDKVTATHLIALQQQLIDIKEKWEHNKYFNGILISIRYNRVVPKSARIQYLLKDGKLEPSQTIKGARFSTITGADGKDVLVHVFTHYVSISAIESTIQKLQDTINVLNKYYDGYAIQETTLDINRRGKTEEYQYTNILRCLKDASYIDCFELLDNTHDVTENVLVSLYEVSNDLLKTLSDIGINVSKDNVLNKVTFLLNAEQYRVLKDKMPYLVSMEVKDLREWADECSYNDNIPNTDIGKPGNEPIIGVIDTPCAENTYFSEWVEYISMMPDIDIKPIDYNHGTAVTSLIVNGPGMNSNLDDGCGCFRVRHFGIAPYGKFSSLDAMKKIRQIVSQNQDIKVWNLSLGSSEEINNNFISIEGAELDRLQSEYDVTFVVAGTNDADCTSRKRIGAPADSLNAIVVNSVGFDNSEASYTRQGPVLSFFHKPDVAYYGGDGKTQIERIRVCKPTGEDFVAGTSFAAPLIARKLAYLIQILGLNRELAKALIIDSATGWSPLNSVSNTKGYGVVPINIKDIVSSNDDEIKFLLTGDIKEYETYTYNIPIPMEDGAFPYYSRATLVYFPYCDRSQGVDYTLTEMDMHLGRVADEKIKAINNNLQGEEGGAGIYEMQARKVFRKWDNVKHVCEDIKKRPIPRKAYKSGMWGLSIKVKERVKGSNSKGLKFGVVITIKEMNNVNRIDDFIQRCSLRGWIVNRLNVENLIDVYNFAEEEISFE